MKVLAIIQARTTSKRLPNKILLLLDGKTVLEHCMSRVFGAKLIDQMVVAYPLGEASLPIQKICANLDIMGFAGSEDDVLDRYYQCARLLKPKHIVRITSDCPLVDSDLIDRVIAYHIAENATYTSNRLNEPAYPDGEDIEVFTFDALERAWKYSVMPYDREHVSTFIKADPSNKCCHYPAPCDMGDIKYSLDTMEDYEEIRRRYYGSDYIGY